MKITFLGTSSGKTSLQRFHSSLLFSSKNYNLLVDSGDGSSRALIANGTSFDSVNGILLSHFHADHYSGLASLITQMKLVNRPKPLDIFVHNSLKRNLQEFLIRSYLLPDRTNFIINYFEFDDDNEVRIAENFLFIAKQNSHLSHLSNYKRLYPDLPLYSASFLFKFDSKKIIYTSDIGSEDDLFLFNEIIPDIYICEITHISYHALVENILGKMQGKIYLTHYDDDAIQQLNEILSSLPKNLSDRVYLAEDRLSLEI